MDEALDDIIDMMETLLKDYSNQDKQLNRIHGKLSLVQHGYNSLKHELSTVECSMSGAIGESSNAAKCLDQHKEQTATDLCDIQTCINDACEILDRIEDFIHPCGHGDWRFVVREDYSNFNTDCRDDWEPIVIGSDRFCGRQSSTAAAGTCDSAFIDVDGEYRRVCGHIHAFHGGQAVAFAATDDIEMDYLTGVSLTHGGNTLRQHIWSFAIGETEDSSSLPGAEERLCPCHDDGDPGTIPTFVGNDYFCEAALEGPFDPQASSSAVFLDDLLWDGRQCTVATSCCDTNNPPYFNKILSGPTSDDLEVRICLPTAESNVLVQQIEIYVI